MSMSYKFFGQPRSSKEAIDKIVQSQSKKVNLRLEQKILNGNLKTKLIVGYKVTTSLDKQFNFNLTVPYRYDLGKLAFGQSKDFQKAITYIKNQVDTLENQGIKVSVYAPSVKRFLTEKDFEIMLKE